MNVKLLEIFTIVTSIGLLVATKASTYPITKVFAEGDKCISSDGDIEAGSNCDVNKKSGFFSSDAKKVYRESADKCSSSQTSFGEFGNWKKLN